eukprot:s1306_g10.t1
MSHGVLPPLAKWTGEKFVLCSSPRCCLGSHGTDCCEQLNELSHHHRPRHRTERPRCRHGKRKGPSQEDFHRTVCSPCPTSLPRSKTARRDQFLDLEPAPDAVRTAIHPFSAQAASVLP